MRKIMLLFVFSFFLLSNCLIKAQSIQLFTEDFQTSGSSFTLGGSGPGTNIGPNQWIINDQYDGTPTYPNTMSEDSTYSGTIAYAPYSKYLHIYDMNSGITNCNYNPIVQSDHFAYMTSGICTFGIDSVHFSFFYLCQGSATAYGKVYYSINNGPWIQTGQSLYSNKYKWQYEDITSPAFSHVGNLRFGFRWENDNGAAINSEAFAVDDIDIVGFYDAIHNPVDILVDSVTPNPVCQNTYLTVYYHLTDTLCDGSYTLQISNSSGSFPGPNSWVININYPQTSGVVTIQLPVGITAASCYRFRIIRQSPQPYITGTQSSCFSVIVCQNVINTLKPSVTLDTNAVCIGSAIDVPFTSTGLYSYNTYTAQLSDASGSFSNPTVIGTFANSSAYDPALGSSPGSVPGIIPSVTAGCNYYIRVVSSNPVATSASWGPFCIGQCDITTNNATSLHFCVTDCSASPLGENSNITIDVGNCSATYSSGNVFTTQLLNNQYFTQIGANGILGSVVSTHDTSLTIHIPCKDSLQMIGVPVGISYLRIIATNSSLPDNSLGSLIRLTIGATHADAEIITSYDYHTFLPRDTFCTNDIAASYFSPYDYFANSTYMWICNGINGGTPFVSPDGANSNSLYLTLGSPSILTLKVQETSYGCVGPWSTIHTIVVLGAPVVPISGPYNICIGDTVLYQVPFYNNTYYNWTANNASVVDTANNVIHVSYYNTGNYSLTMTSINQCGSTTSNKPIQVNPYPIISGGADQTVCDGIPVILAGSGATSFSWNNGVINGSPFHPAVGTTTYTVIGTTNGCSDTDYVSITVNALPSVSAGADKTICAGQPVTLTGTGTATSYTWNNGVSNGVAFIPASTNTYIVTGIDGNGCAKTDTTIVNVNALPTPTITGSLSYCAGTNTTLNAGNYSFYVWSTTDTIQTIHATIANNPLTVTVTDINGCIGTSASVNLVENPLPAPIITGSLSYCTGSHTTLDAGNYSSYLWSTTDTTQTINATIANNPLTVTVTDINGCIGTSAGVNLVKNPLPIPTITGSLSYCAGLYTTLTTEVYNNYQWSDGSIGQSTNVTIDDNPITVTVTDANGCSQTQTATVSQNPSPTVIVTANQTDIISGSNTQLNASGGVTYQWTPITGLSCNTCFNPYASPTTTTTYCARVTDNNGCVDSACVVITVEIPCGEIFVPNAFSPNGDGANEQECVRGNCIQTFHFVIYDRWGEKVFETTDINQCWDGMFKGKQMNTAVYVYFMEATITTGEKVTKKGNISLVR